MFPLHNRILLWSVNTAGLMYNSMRIEEIKHDKLLGIISFNSFDFKAKLSMNHSIERRE